MTVEEILAALQAILDEAGTDPLTDEQVQRYEALEGQLERTRKTEEIQKRNKAYNSVTATSVHTGATKKGDDTLERAFTHYLRTGVANQDIAELRAQSSGSDSAGGYMVPAGFRQKLVEVQKAFGGFANEADSYSTDTGNSVEFPSLDDTANSGTITGEGSAVSGGADMAFGTVNLGAYKYTSSGASNAPLKVSVELLQDSAFDVDALISRKLGERIARKQAPDWVVGTGSGQPFGVLHAGLTADVTITGATISYDNLIDVEAALDAAYEQNAKWLMNRATWAILRKVKDTAGRPLLLEQAASGMGQGVQRTLLGYPVVIDQACPNNAINTKFLALGDFRESYVIRRVSNLVVMVNPYSSAANGQVEYHAWERADGNIQNRKSYAVLARGAS